MRIVIDLQSVQSATRYRGIGRYSLELTKAIVKQCPQHEIIILLNGSFAAESTDYVRYNFENILPKENIKIWYPIDEDTDNSLVGSWEKSVNELIRENFIKKLNPDVVLITSLFGAGGAKEVISIGKLFNMRTACIVYDFTPIVHKKWHLMNPEKEKHYLERLNNLQRANLLLSISEATALDALSYTSAHKYEVVNISAAADGIFKIKKLSTDRKKAVMQKFNIYNDFIICNTHVGNPSKNLENLIAAYSLLPKKLRANYQLVVISTCDENSKNLLLNFVRQQGLKKHELIITGYISDDDMIDLYNMSNFAVLPSLYEGFGFPILEAMSCGKAVICSNTSSMPEVVGNENALFHPQDVGSIFNKIKQLVEDRDFRPRLEKYACKQAKKFSWNKSAEKAMLAIEKLQKLTAPTKQVLYCNHRPRLAYISPLPPEESGISYYSMELLPELSLYYDIEVIVIEPNLIVEPWLLANCKLRSVDYFKDHFTKYDRVLYHFGNSAFHAHMFELLYKIPGIVVMHDFFLSGLLHYIEHTGTSNIWKKSLYSSHGYKALLEYCNCKDNQDILGIIKKYPCNLDVLQNSLGVITHSKEHSFLIKDFYDFDYSVLDEHVMVIPHWHAPSKVSNADNNITKKQVKTSTPAIHNLRQYGKLYFNAIEHFYQNAQTHPYFFSRKINTLDETTVQPSSRLIKLSGSLATSFPKPFTKKQILIDVSHLAHFPDNTGIQRLIKSVLLELIKHPPRGFYVEPVHSHVENTTYKYARRFTSDFLGCPDNGGLEDEEIVYSPGDIFLIIDPWADLAAIQKDYYRKLRSYGVLLKAVLHDILPITHADFFPPHAAIFSSYLSSISEGDEIICNSCTTAKEYIKWLESQSLDRHTPLKISWFNLGSDIADTHAGLSDLEESSYEFLTKIHAKPTFLVVGTIEPRKGHKQILKAFEELWSRGFDLNLVFVGKQGWMVENLIYDIKKHVQMNKKLFWFRGYKEANDEFLKQLYKHSVCLINASEAEGFGLPLVEAAKHNLPIIARDIPVFREVTEGHAFFFKTTEGKELAASIEKWLELFYNNNHPKSSKIRIYSWEESAEQLKNILLDKPHDKLVKCHHFKNK